MTPFSLVLILIYALINPSGIIILKKEFNKIKTTNYKELSMFLLSNPRIYLGVTLSLLIPTLIFVFLLSKIQATTLQPMLSISYVSGYVLSIIFLNEPSLIKRWIGISVIMVGIMLIALSS